MNKLRIMAKEIDLENSKILYKEQFSKEILKQYWEPVSGEWWIEDEWLVGKNPGNFGGMIYSKNDYMGNILMDFEGRTILPSSNDLNFTWASQGWDSQNNDAGISYIAGLEGWWEGKAGMEKYPECKVSTATPLFDFEPGRLYHIQAGSIDGHCFIFVDGKLIIEMTDPEPIDTSLYAKIGFGTYASYIQVRNLIVREIKWDKFEMSYTPNFK